MEFTPTRGRRCPRLSSVLPCSSGLPSEDTVLYLDRANTSLVGKQPPTPSRIQTGYFSSNLVAKGDVRGPIKVDSRLDNDMLGAGAEVSVKVHRSVRRLTVVSPPIYCKQGGTRLNVNKVISRWEVTSGRSVHLDEVQMTRGRMILAALEEILLVR